MRLSRLRGSLSLLVRVTECLNYFKEPWYIDWIHRVGRTEANRVSKHSMKIGSRVDEIIKANGAPTTKDNAEVHSCMASYNKWKAIYQPKEIVNGERLYRTIDGLEVTGEPDIFVDGVLVDIKCSSKISPGYWLQVNAYRYLQGDKGRVGILRLDKTTGSYEYVVKDYDQRLVECWIGLLKAFVYYKGDDDGGLNIQEI